MDFPWLFVRDGVNDSLRSAFYGGYAAEAQTRLPQRWIAQAEVLSLVALLELILWAQSALDDINQRRNLHFYAGSDRAFLARLVRRITEADKWLNTRGHHIGPPPARS
jgi:hypothetical protein